MKWSHHRRRRFCSCRLPAWETDRAAFIMKTQFDGIAPAWTVSVLRDRADRVPLYGLIDEHEELAAGEIAGFAAQWVFPCYAKSPARFTGRVEDDWQLYALYLGDRSFLSRSRRRQVGVATRVRYLLDPCIAVASGNIALFPVNRVPLARLQVLRVAVEPWRFRAGKGLVIDFEVQLLSC